MSGRPALASVASASLVVLLSVVSSCTTTPRTGPSSTPSTRRARTPRVHNGKVGIVLFGRSVTQQWFRHWGVAPERGVTKGRYQLLHRVFSDYLPSESGWPEQIDRIVRRYAKHLQAVHYKHCFVDFEANTDLSRYQRIADAVRRAVVQRQGKALIIGNALPLVEQASSAAIVAKQRAYNAWLRTFAAKHPRVFVFDQYQVLSTHEGYLKAEYAVSPSDSHLNKAGYQALDVAYFTFLARAFPK